MCRRRPLPRSGKPWDIDTPIDMAFPCATQNEVLLADAKTLASHGCKYVLEGANMPCTPEAAHHFIKNDIVYVCGKAANAGACVPGWKKTQGSPSPETGLQALPGQRRTACWPARLASRALQARRLAELALLAAVQAAWP